MTDPVRIDFEYPFTLNGVTEPHAMRVADYFDLEERKLLIDPDALVVRADRLAIVFEYPLQRPCTRIVEHAGGFTRMALFQAIAEGYQAIYAEEEAGLPADVPTATPLLLNRASTNGQHGIWGHGMDDLFLEGAFLHDETLPRLELAVGS